jgi:hypothetical protein
LARIAFILLCHKDPDAIVKQAQRLTATGDYIAIHFDARAKKEDFDRIKTALKNNANVAFAKRRVKCGWGEWSLVDATLRAVTAAEEAFPKATHFYMLSGDCMAIKSAAYTREFLDGADKDYIESFDFFSSDWIKTGMKEDRLVFRHYFNERNHKDLFYASVKMQRKLGLIRKVPTDIQMMIGSQWWCLRRRTIEWVLDFTKKRKDVVRFFKTTWIPDETYFQTIVRHVVPGQEIDARTPTFLMFSDYGMPVTFYNDQYDILLSQDYLFARKISPDAIELKRRLGDLWANNSAEFQISNEGRTLHKFLAGRGRVGRRFAPRFWERESTLGRERELLILICKKWHVAKRLLEASKEITGIQGVAYLFDEESTELPDLGGVQSTLGKRARHRRAMMRMLFDSFQINRLMICLDPNNMELLEDFYSDHCTTSILDIDCSFSDDYLRGHAKRVGLAGEVTPTETLDRLVPTIRHDFAYETDAIRDANFANYFRIREANSVEDNRVQIAHFFRISDDKADVVAETEHLFAG